MGDNGWGAEADEAQKRLRPRRPKTSFAWRIATFATFARARPASPRPNALSNSPAGSSRRLGRREPAQATSQRRQFVHLPARARALVLAYVHRLGQVDFSQKENAPPTNLTPGRFYVLFLPSPEFDVAFARIRRCRHRHRHFASLRVRARAQTRAQVARTCRMGATPARANYQADRVWRVSRRACSRPPPSWVGV